MLIKRIAAFLFGLGFLLCASFAFSADVYFQWGAATGVVDGYRIYHGDSLGGPYPELLCGVNGTTLDCVAPLSEDREYFLVCRAFNARGEGGDSNEIHWSYEDGNYPSILLHGICLQGCGIN